MVNSESNWEGADGHPPRPPDIVERLNRLIADLEVKPTVLDAMDNLSRRLRSKVEKAAADDA